jgi:hypothetical protein
MSKISIINAASSGLVFFLGREVANFFRPQGEKSNINDMVLSEKESRSRAAMLDGFKAMGVTAEVEFVSIDPQKKSTLSELVAPVLETLSESDENKQLTFAWPTDRNSCFPRLETFLSNKDVQCYKPIADKHPFTNDLSVNRKDFWHAMGGTQAVAYKENHSSIVHFFDASLVYGFLIESIRVGRKSANYTLQLNLLFAALGCFISANAISRSLALRAEYQAAQQLGTEKILMKVYRSQQGNDPEGMGPKLMHSLFGSLPTMKQRIGNLSTIKRQTDTVNSNNNGITPLYNHGKKGP